jgi:hypothetical protein
MLLLPRSNPLQRNKERNKDRERESLINNMTTVSVQFHAFGETPYYLLHVHIRHIGKIKKFCVGKYIEVILPYKIKRSIENILLSHKTNMGRI